MKKIIINLAPTGLIPNKNITPFVPQQPEEIISDVMKCVGLGVSMIYLHACEPGGTPAYKKEIYGEIICGIRERNKDLIIVASTSGRIFGEFEKRSDVLDLDDTLKPDMASLTLGSLNFASTASMNSPEMIVKLLEKMQQRGIKPELEVFDLGMVNYAHYLIKKGLLEPPYYFNILLGNIATAQARLLHLGLMVCELPDNSYWTLAGFGNFQTNMNILGITMGDGVRVGLEDNIWYDEEKTVPASNYLLVERVAKIASLIGRPVASPLEVRKMLNIPDME